MDQHTLVVLTADIVASRVANNATPLSDVSMLVEVVYCALSGLDAGQEQPQQRTPIVPVKASVKPDFIVCLECGSKQKMLMRHIRTAHGMSPDEYRAAFCLSPAYPMVTSNLASVRREIARANGLGRRPVIQPGK